MKITKAQLKQVIKEEIEAAMSEKFDPSKQAPKKLTYIKLTKKGRNYDYTVGNNDEQVEAKYFEVDHTGYAALALGEENGFFLDKNGINGLTIIVDSDNPSTENLMKNDLKRQEPKFKGKFEKMTQQR